MKFKTIKVGDVISFRTSDDKYKVIFCTRVRVEKSPCFYIFALTDINLLHLPDVSDIIDCNFFAKGNLPNYLYSEMELMKMWTFYPEIKPYVLASWGLMIDRKDLMRFKEKLFYLGNIEVCEHLNSHGNGTMGVNDWEQLNGYFTDNNLDELMKRHGQSKYKIKAIIK